MLLMIFGESHTVSWLFLSFFHPALMCQSHDLTLYCNCARFMLIGFWCDLLLVRLGMHACSLSCSWDALQVCSPPMRLCLSLIGISQCCDANCSRRSLSDHRVMFHTAIATWRFGTIREDFRDFKESLLTNFMSGHPFPCSCSLLPLHYICCAAFLQRQPSSRNPGGRLTIARPPDGATL
jgi:hypothetical protein